MTWVVADFVGWWVHRELGVVGGEGGVIWVAIWWIADGAPK